MKVVVFNNTTNNNNKTKTKTTTTNVEDLITYQ